MGTVQKLFITLCIGIGFAPTSVRAQLFTIEKERFSVDLPKDSQAAPGLYGAPLMILGPEDKSSESRTTMIITPTGAKAPEFDLSANQKKEEAAYREGREAWLKKVGGASEKYLPLSTEKWGELTVQKIGYTYRVGSESFSESTYYVSCEGKFFHLKLLQPASSAMRPEKAEAMVRSFKCER